MTRAVVRPGRLEEIPEVLGLWREAGSVPGVSDDPASLERLLETSEDALLVAEVAGRMVGTVIAGWDGWRANFYRLAVLPSARRRGIALRLVAEAERRLAAKDARRLSAIVLSEHDPAVALWLSGLPPRHPGRPLRPHPLSPPPLPIRPGGAP